MLVHAIGPQEAQSLVKLGAILVDIRGADEHAREHIPGTVHLPLDRIAELPGGQAPVIFHCRSGMRTSSNAMRLLAAAQGAPCYLLEGGIEAWRSAGLPTRLDKKQPIEVMRQVQLIAGGLVLLGLLLGSLVASDFFLLSALVGGGLMFAGATGWCGMATMLRAMPWNRQAPQA